MEFHISTTNGRGGEERKVECNPILFDKKLMIDTRKATNAQQCLINIAKGQVAFARRMASPHDPNLKGIILATATKDEHGKDWKALVYAADEEGKDLRYIGSHEMPEFTKNEAKIVELQKKMSDLRHHYTEMGRRILPKSK